MTNMITQFNRSLGETKRKLPTNDKPTSSTEKLVREDVRRLNENMEELRKLKENTEKHKSRRQ